MTISAPFLAKPSISGVIQQLVEESKKETEKAASAEFMSIAIADAFLPEPWQARQDRCAKTEYQFKQLLK